MRGRRAFGRSQAIGPRGPIDPDLTAPLAAADDSLRRLEPGDIPAIRTRLATARPSLPELARGHRVVLHERTVAGASAGVAVTTVAPVDGEPTATVVFLHGGGLVLGDRHFEGGHLIDLAEKLRVEVLAVEYRLAPEHPYPAALDDAVAVIAGAPADRPIIVAGRSAGGGLAAAAAFACRDGGVRLDGALLIYPMLDDRTVGSGDAGFPVWDVASNATGWGAYAAPPGGVPARRRDVSGLAPIYLEVGSADLFRTECAAFAAKLWAAGGACELHVWSGAFHGSDHAVPKARVSRAQIAARFSWLTRVAAAGRPAVSDSDRWPPPEVAGRDAPLRADIG